LTSARKITHHPEASAIEMPVESKKEGFEEPQGDCEAMGRPGSKDRGNAAVTPSNQGRGRVRELEARVAELDLAIREYQKENQFFEMLIQSLPGIFYLIDDRFNVYKWNKNVERVTGYTSEEIPTKDIFVLFEGESLRLARDAIQKAFATGHGVVEAELISREGKRIPHFFTGVTAKIGGVSYLIGMGTDISERKRAEDALRESEALYRIFAERMTEGVVLCQNSRIVFVNNTFVSMFEYPGPEELLGRDVMTLVSQGFEIYFREMVEGIEKGVDQERSFQARSVAKNGREIWVEGRGNLIQWKGLPTVLLMARDITEAKQRELSMQEEAEHLRRENVSLRSSMKDRYRFGNILGKSPAMQEVYSLILDAAATSANVVIYGESGTGKELVARAIHDMSSQSQKAFVTVNCAAIPENLLESEFFGHKKGAFTGAYADKRGYLDLANGGTLFLDEVGELSASLQAKLLRALEGGGYSPVGSHLTMTSDFRIIAATNRDLMDLVRRGAMREDFFYRIHIIPMHLPPLRSRKDDIPLLVEHFLATYSGDRPPPPIPGRLLEALLQYDWPGNVRELRNAIQRYVAVRRLDIPVAPAAPAASPTAAGPALDGAPQARAQKSALKRSIETLERASLKEALDRHGGNKSRAAESLGISRKTLFRKLKRYRDL
jgi:PAS domain S-box-containing protein